MNRTKKLLADAKVEERLAHARWYDTLGKVQARLKPSAIADDAVDGVKKGVRSAMSNAGEQAKKHPGVVVAAVGALTLFAFRKPLAEKIRFSSADDEETTSSPETLPQHDDPITDQPDITAPPPLIMEEL